MDVLRAGLAVWVVALLTTSTLLVLVVGVQAAARAWQARRARVVPDAVVLPAPARTDERAVA